MPEIYNKFVVNPEGYWRPSYRVSPFNTGFISRNNQLIKEGIINNELIRSFFGENFIYLQNGKSAINLALRQYFLKKDDEVWIVTPSDNKYISSCVTNEIEKFCKWSRKKSVNTKLIFVNHEFGICYKELTELKKYDLPIIEDRALSFLSSDDEFLTGKVGDFVVYSLPKIFPVNFGGILQINDERLLNKAGKINATNDFYLSVLLSHYLKEVASIRNTRIKNYNYLSKLFTQLNFLPRFTLSRNEVPGVFMFKAPHVNLDLLKTFMQNNGVESSVFYGEDAFFIPVHQELVQSDMDFFFSLVKYFMEYGNQ